MYDKSAYQREKDPPRSRSQPVRLQHDEGGLRCRLLPYLYSEYMKGALRDEMMFRPLAFDYPKDVRAAAVEDQLLVGDGMMIAPVYEQNAEGRYVYLPESMKLVRFRESGVI